MILSPAQIMRRPGLFASVQRQSLAFLEVNDHSPRLASVFASQQRWLLAHIGLSLHFTSLNDPSVEPLNAARFLQEVLVFNVASRNTAAAFLAEMLKYGIVEPRPSTADRRKRFLEPTPATVAAIDLWTRIHLNTLDGLDGAARLARYDASPEGLQFLQPFIAQGLLSSLAIREPDRDFSQFMWLNDGFLITERLVASLRADDWDAGKERVASSMSSISEVASGLRVSRSHAALKLREAETNGTIGWQGKRGRSPLWVSHAFLLAFLNLQANKLALIDASFFSCFPDAQITAVRGSSDSHAVC